MQRDVEIVELFDLLKTLTKQYDEKDYGEYQPPPTTKFDYTGSYDAVDKDIKHYLEHGRSWEGCGWSRFNDLEFEPVPQADHIIRKNRPRVKFSENFVNSSTGETSAAYTPDMDRIILPPIYQYNSTNDAYATVFHEMGHWTGYESRLNRRSLMSYAEGDLDNKAQEEMIAEWTAAYVTGALGICEPESRANYLRHWLKNCHAWGDKRERMIKEAISKARDAANYILANAE